MQYWNGTTAEANVAYFLSASQGLGAFCNIKYQSFTRIKSNKYFFLVVELIFANGAWFKWCNHLSSFLKLLNAQPHPFSHNQLGDKVFPSSVKKESLYLVYSISVICLIG